MKPTSSLVLLLFCPFVSSTLSFAKSVPNNRFLIQSSPKPTAPVKTDDLSNIENLLGYWFFPHSATINIRFYRNKTFVFNDYNSTLGKEEKLQGTYQLDKGTLTLLYNDRPKQTFKFYKGEKGDSNYYIKRTGYYFVKGENGDGNE